MHHYSSTAISFRLFSNGTANISWFQVLYSNFVTPFLACIGINKIEKKKHILVDAFVVLQLFFVWEQKQFYSVDNIEDFHSIGHWGKLHSTCIEVDNWDISGCIPQCWNLQIFRPFRFLRQINSSEFELQSLKNYNFVSFSGL